MALKNRLSPISNTFRDVGNAGGEATPNSLLTEAAIKEHQQLESTGWLFSPPPKESAIRGGFAALSAEAAQADAEAARATAAAAQATARAELAKASAKAARLGRPTSVADRAAADGSLSESSPSKENAASLNLAIGGNFKALLSPPTKPKSPTSSTAFSPIPDATGDSDTYAVRATSSRHCGARALSYPACLFAICVCYLATNATACRLNSGTSPPTHRLA